MNSIPIQFVRKLWTDPNKDLMLKIDKELVEARSDELKGSGFLIKNPMYKPLAFSLESEKVNTMLRSNNIGIV